MNNKIKYGLMGVLLVVSLNVFAGSDEKNASLNSAQWLFNVRTNLNSAAFIAGTAAAWHALYYTALPATKAGIEYAFGTIGKEALVEKLKNSKSTLTTAFFFAGLALALEGVNKFYLRDKFYAAKNKKAA